MKVILERHPRTWLHEVSFHDDMKEFVYEAVGFGGKRTWRYSHSDEYGMRHYQLWQGVES